MSPVFEKVKLTASIRVPRDGDPVGKRVDHHRPKYYLMTDRGALMRKGEKDPRRGRKENLKPCAYKHSKHVKV